MSEFSFPGMAIEAGFPWQIQLMVEGVALFPVESTYTAHIRRQAAE